jgi:hypothetical protein
MSPWKILDSFLFLIDLVLKVELFFYFLLANNFSFLKENKNQNNTYLLIPKLKIKNTIYSIKKTNFFFFFFNIFIK